VVGLGSIAWTQTPLAHLCKLPHDFVLLLSEDGRREDLRYARGKLLSVVVKLDLKQVLALVCRARPAVVCSSWLLLAQRLEPVGLGCS